MKTNQLLLAAAALAFLVANKCDGKDEEAARPHPGCPGDSIVGAETGACVCPKGKVLTAESLQCKDCDPVPSNGTYCDCGRNSVFSLDASLDTTLGLRSPQVTCEIPNDCERGYYLTPGGCTQCQEGQCGECGQCAVGETCISGFCAAVLTCRVSDVYPDYYFAPQTNPRGDRCEHRKGELCGFATPADFSVGEACSCNDSVDCYYEGRVEALSR